MSYESNNSKPQHKEVVRFDPSIAATEVRLRDFIDPLTAEVLISDFDGEGGDLWHDALGNLQLRRLWKPDQRTFGLDEPMLNKLDALSFTGKKSIVAHDGNQTEGLLMTLADALLMLAGQKQAVWHPVRLPKHFDMETGKLVERSAVGPGCDLWRDALGNIQVRTRAKTNNGIFRADFGLVAIARLRQLPCTGSRSILLIGASESCDFVLPVTEPQNPELKFGSGYTVRRNRRLH